MGADLHACAAARARNSPARLTLSKKEELPLCAQCNQRHGTALGYRAYGRHRKVSLMAVQKAIALGRIREAVLPGKKIDVEIADREWKENSSPLPPHNKKSSHEDDSPPPPEDSSAVKFAEARARKETALAEKHETELKKLLGELIPVDDAAQQLAESLEAVSKGVRSLRTRLVRELSAAGVIVKGKEKRSGVIVEEEIDRVLEELQRAGDHLPSDEDASSSSGELEA